MKSPIRTVVGVFCILCMLSAVTYAQNAAQGIRGAAEGLSDQVQKQQNPITTGPKDDKEKVKPGKIDENASPEFKTTASGLRYRILRASDKRKPTRESSVEVHYKGWLDNQTIFDSSYQRGKTLSFPLSGVIPGWTEGMQLIGQGGMIELDIPSELGYGPRGTPGGPIPPNARLHFIVELVSIK